MKLTKTQLREIIKEEIHSLNETRLKDKIDKGAEGYLTREISKLLKQYDIIVPGSKINLKMDSNNKGHVLSFELPAELGPEVKDGNRISRYDFERQYSDELNRKRIDYVSDENGSNFISTKDVKKLSDFLTSKGIRHSITKNGNSVKLN
jgi:hypothetical protein